MSLPAFMAKKNSLCYGFMVVMIRVLNALITLQVLGAPQEGGANYTTCRCLPDQYPACWPSLDSWNDLNSSLGGRLLRPAPPASPCYAPNLNSTACQIAVSNWRNPFWRADQVGAMQYANREAHGNESCLLTSDPSSNASFCHQGAIPAYAVEALEPSHVQTTVRYAAQHNLRITIKATGHDILGRSTAPGSLNVWVHRLKQITFHDAFIPEGCAGNDSAVPAPAVTAGSGTQWQELYKAADSMNVVVVGSMSGSVSTGGGYLQGGGHSPLSPLLGMAADNVVELKVVTADGRLRTANSCQNRDLFWALRGGGGGTFGAVVSATHRTFPALSNAVGVLFTATSNNATSFEELLAIFVRLQSSMAEADNWAGYSYVSADPFSLIMNYLLPNSDTSIAQAALQPLLTFTSQHPDEIIAVNVTIDAFPSFLAWHNTVLCSANPGVCSDASGSNAAIASRLLPQEPLQEHATHVARAFMEILSVGIQKVVGHLVGGRAVANPGAAANVSSSINPAWRKGVWHVVLVTSWRDQESHDQKTRDLLALTQMNGLLRDLSPGSGSYLNEADVNEPNWQQAFFGENYSRLKRIKERVDPDGLLSCRNCVGSEDWTNDQNCRLT